MINQFIYIARSKLITVLLIVAIFCLVNELQISRNVITEILRRRRNWLEAASTSQGEEEPFNAEERGEQDNPPASGTTEYLGEEEVNTSGDFLMGRSGESLADTDQPITQLEHLYTLSKEDLANHNRSK